MKVRSSVRRICENCKLVKRKGVVRVIVRCSGHSVSPILFRPEARRRDDLPGRSLDGPLGRVIGRNSAEL